ncbi:hypothetical protein CBL_00201 [Carabus blaptoides fortunei]
MLLPGTLYVCMKAPPVIVALEEMANKNVGRSEEEREEGERMLCTSNVTFYQCSSWQLLPLICNSFREDPASWRANERQPYDDRLPIYELGASVSSPSARQGGHWTTLTRHAKLIRSQTRTLRDYQDVQEGGRETFTFQKTEKNDGTSRDRPRNGLDFPFTPVTYRFEARPLGFSASVTRPNMSVPMAAAWYCS